MLNRSSKHKKDPELSITIDESTKVSDLSYEGFVETAPERRPAPVYEDENSENTEARLTPSELYRNIVKENEEIMSEFENDILKDREKQYGNPVEMHNRIAEIWSGILNHPVTGYEVALCMTGLKLARATKNASDPDSLIDAHGYAEIAQMIWADTEKGNK